MDPFWDPPIHCSGRIWPNGPYGAYLGTTARPNPQWWVIVSFLPGPSWPAAGELVPMNWFMHEPATGSTLNAIWRWFISANPDANALARLTITRLDAAGFKVALRLQQTPLELGYNANYERTLSPHLPVGFTDFKLPLVDNFHDPPGMTWPAEIRVRAAEYADMPEGRCLPGF